MWYRGLSSVSIKLGYSEEESAWKGSGQRPFWSRTTADEADGSG